VSVRNRPIGTAWKNTTDSLTRMYTMPTVVNTDTSAARKRISSMIRSRTTRARRRGKRAAFGIGIDPDSSETESALRASLRV
jgi:hypothetical protein